MKKASFLKHETSSNLSSSSGVMAGTPVPSKPLFKSAVFELPTVASLSDTPYSPQLVDATPTKISDLGQPFALQQHGWDVTKLSLLTLCVFYRLEPNHVFFSQELLLSVLARLQELFRQLSLSVQFRHGDANTTVSAVARSMDGVEFVVYVWDNDDNQCILEVQRTGGPTERFCGHGYAQKVLDVVQCFDTTVRDVDPMDFSMEETKQNQGAVDKVWTRFGTHAYQPKKEDVDSSFAIVLSLLTSTFLHHVGMGLESLLSMTDPCNSGLESAMRCANEVVSGMFSDSIMYHLNDATHGHTALQVLTQALNLASGPQVQDTTRKLVPYFLECVQKAKSSPHTAYLATHSLYITCKHCPDIQNEVHLHVIKDAKEFGRYGHAGLEHSCERLLGLLEYAHA